MKSGRAARTSADNWRISRISRADKRNTIIAVTPPPTSLELAATREYSIAQRSLVALALAGRITYRDYRDSIREPQGSGIPRRRDATRHIALAHRILSLLSFPSF